MISYIPLICVVIAILACVYASYSDLKRGIIPNKLTLPLIVVGLVLNGIYFLWLGDLTYFAVALVVTGIIYVLGRVFWELGAWAGGDVKLFIALAALLPFPIYLVHYQILGVQMPYFAYYPFPFTLIINSILGSLPVLLTVIFYTIFKRKRYLLSELFEPVKEYKKNMIIALVVTSAVTITLLITKYLPFQVLIVSLILIYLLSLVISKLPNRIKAVLVSIVTVYALYQNFPLTVSGIVIIFISITVIGIIRKLLTTVNTEALQDDYAVKDLKEGMIPAFKLFEKDDGTVYFDKKSLLTKFLEAIKLKDIDNLLNILMPKDKLLIDFKSAGLSQSDLNLLNQLLNDEKIEDKFRTRRGIPFSPNILVGLLISLFIGDLAVMFFQAMQLLI